MEIVTTIAACRSVRRRFASIGLVPTMGYLHEGHLSLVRRAKAECGAAAVSVFVNPTQFGRNEDFAKYPRDTERDLRMLREVGTDLVFIPPVEEMYPPGFTTYVAVEQVTERLEGAVRPGHFRGVTTVVCKLLNIVQATRAYFGQKDAQQSVVIRRMARDLDIDTKIVICPTLRESDGLAMSSRNVYLTPEQRQAAPVLFRALSAAQQRYANGERDAATLRSVINNILAGEPLGQPDYVSVAHPLTLDELETIGPEGAVVSLAVRFGKTRLLDNVLLGV
jgi:pantoate--beta-alanine ligase